MKPCLMNWVSEFVPKQSKHRIDINETINFIFRNNYCQIKEVPFLGISSLYSYLIRHLVFLREVTLLDMKQYVWSQYVHILTFLWHFGNILIYEDCLENSQTNKMYHRASFSIIQVILVQLETDFRTLDEP